MKASAKRNDGVEVRKVRIQTVVQTLVAALNQNNGLGWIPLESTFADIEYEMGLTPKRILEYASIGEKRGLYVIDLKNKQIRKVEG